MRRLLPDPQEDLPLSSLYADLRFASVADRPTVFVNVVASLDGVVAVDGTSGSLGGEADLHAFRRLRATADAVMVGAATVRAEDYRGVRLPEEVRAQRRAAGRDEVPPIAVVTASLDLDPQARLFHDTARSPWLVVPGDRAVEAEDRFGDIAEVVPAGTDRVDVTVAVRSLGDRGVRWLLCEGGPLLNRQLFDAELVDELFLTLAPTLVGAGPHVVGGALEGRLPRLEPLEIHEHDAELLLRLRVVTHRR